MAKTAVVTGASRGLGRGIARALGAEGWTVFVTGRTSAGLEEAVSQIEALGGRGIAVVCDHGEDAQTAALFERVKAVAPGLDLLVNNATAVYGQELVRDAPFWEKDLFLADMIQIGLRSNNIAAWHAAPLMIDRDDSLIVNISFYGAVSYFHGPAYGAAKAGTDKMTYDMGRDFAPTKTSIMSLWPGYVLTDEVRGIPAEYLADDFKALLPDFETPEYSGRVILALHSDPEKKAMSGQALIGAALAAKYGVTDRGGETCKVWSDPLGSPVSYPHGAGARA